MQPNYVTYTLYTLKIFDALNGNIINLFSDVENLIKKLFFPNKGMGVIEGTSVSDVNCKIEHRALGSVVRRNPFSLRLESSPIDAFGANGEGR